MPWFLWNDWWDDEPKRPLRLHGGKKRDRGKAKAQKRARRRGR